MAFGKITENTAQIWQLPRAYMIFLTLSGNSPTQNNSQTIRNYGFETFGSKVAKLAFRFGDFLPIKKRKNQERQGETERL